jgi:hypothetical protein
MFSTTPWDVKTVPHEHLPGSGLVHAEPARLRPGTGIRQSGRLQYILYPAVLAEIAVQGDEDAFNRVFPQQPFRVRRVVADYLYRHRIKSERRKSGADGLPGLQRNLPLAGRPAQQNAYFPRSKTVIHIF